MQRVINRRMQSEREPREEDGVSEIHDTEDGPIHLWVYPAKEGGWNAINWGHQLAGARHFKTVAKANAYLLDAFRRMFPEHTCNAKCGTAEAAAQRRAVEATNFRLLF